MRSIGTSATHLRDCVLDAPKTGEEKLSALGDEMVVNVVMVDLLA